MSWLGSRYSLGTWRQGAPVRATIMQYVILVALLPSALGGRYGSVRINLLLCLAVAVWTLAALHPGLRRRPPVMAVFVAGVVALSIALVFRDPWFGFYAYAGYTYSIVLLPWPWPLAGVAATAFVATTSETAGLDRATPTGLAAYAGVLAGNVAVVCGVVWFMQRLETQHEERGRTLDELRETNGKLEAALTENAGLQRQLLTQAREAGILDERQRMAREIHDTLAQGLTGIITQLQAAEHAAGEPAQWREHFAAATRLARESLSEARRSVDALRPEPREKAPLSEALARAAARWSALCGIPAQVATTAQTTGLDRATPAGMAAYAAILAGNVAAICGVVWFIQRLETQHEERGRTLDELRETNRKLEAALTENAGLQRQLLTQAREAGILDERQRMAREIHDTLAQGLTGIITQLQAAEHAAGEPAEWRTHFAAATRLARESLSEARRSVDALRPEPLETARLSEALADIAGRWSKLHGIEARVTVTGTERPLLPEAEIALLRTGQEALANVAKHAQATRVGVTLSYMEHEVALDVRDDGKGFVNVTARGFGLVAMRQRIEGLAGTLQIESEPGLGTGISACVPAAGVSG